MTREQAETLAVAAASGSPWWGGRPVQAVNATRLESTWLVELGTTVDLPDSPFMLVRDSGALEEIPWDHALELLGV